MACMLRSGERLRVFIGKSLSLANALWCGLRLLWRAQAGKLLPYAICAGVGAPCWVSGRGRDGRVGYCGRWLALSKLSVSNRNRLHRFLKTRTQRESSSGEG